MWLLANISGDSVEARDELLNTDYVEHLIEITSQKVVLASLLRLASWGIANLCKGKPEPPIERVTHF